MRNALGNEYVVDCNDVNPVHALFLKFGEPLNILRYLGMTCTSESARHADLSMDPLISG
jgi:hypothetical protein